MASAVQLDQPVKLRTLLTSIRPINIKKRIQFYTFDQTLSKPGPLQRFDMTCLIRCILLVTGIVCLLLVFYQRGLNILLIMPPASTR